MPLFGPPNVENLKAKRNIKGLIKALGYQEDTTVRSAAAEALGQIGDVEAAEPLIAALKDIDKLVRLRAAQALGRIGNERAVKPLIAALRDDDRLMREAAAEALEHLDWQPDKSEAGADYWIVKRQWAKCAKIGAPAVEPLIAVLKDGDDNVRRGVAKALGKTGDPRAVEPLIAALKDGSVRRAAAGALAQIGTSAVEPLVSTLKDNDRLVRKAAARALGQIGDARAIEPLTAALKDGDRLVREAAAEALDNLDWKPGKDRTGATYWIVKRQWDRCAEIGAPAAESLIAALKDEDNDVREASAVTLLEIGAPAVKALIVALKDESVHVTVAEVLSGIGDTRAVEPLIAALRDDDWAMREAAAEALEHLDWQPEESEAGAGYWIVKRQWDRCAQIGAPAVKPLIAALKDGDENSRRGIAQALGEIGDPRAVEPLIATLKDKDEGVREAIIRALAQVGTSAVEPLIAALEGKNKWMREAAARALGQIGDTRSVEPLIATLKDKDRSVCEAAAEALGNLGWKPDQNVTGATYWIAERQWDRCAEIGAPAVEPLAAALKDEDRLVRKATAETLGQIGDPRAVEPLITALKDKDKGVRGAIAKALAQIGVPAVEPLIAALKNRNEDVRQTAIRALGKAAPLTKDARAVEALIAVLKNKRGSKGVRQAAASALGQTGDARSVEPLITALSDADRSVREAAARALRQIGDPRAVEPLITALKDWDPDTCMEAAKALGRIGDERVVEPLIAALKSQHKRVRQAAAKALLRLYRHGDLDVQVGQRILAQRQTMAKPHQDLYLDVCPGHIDTGIGVEL
jgi:HEAT repeat protein